MSEPPSVSGNGLQGSEVFEFLRQLVTVDPSPERIQRIAQSSRSDVDWSELQRSAEFHGVLPLVARNLIEHGTQLPTGVEQSFRSAYESNLQKNLRFSAELGRIVKQSADQQLRVVPFKGPQLAESVYGDLGSRSFSDLDLLIFSGDLGAAKATLAELGYRPSEELSPAVERLLLRTGYERSFDCAAGKNLVELQWAALPYFYAVDLDLDQLLARAGSSIVGCYEISSLSPEDLLLMLCLHAAKHLWTRLIWIADIAQTMRTQSIDYGQVADRGRALGIGRILGISYWLAKHVLQAEPPDAAQHLMGADSRVPVLGAEFAERIAHGATYDFESTKYFRQILSLRERRRDRWRYVWRLVWTPSSADVAAVRLPEALFPLLRIVRIGRLARKLVLRADG